MDEQNPAEIEDLVHGAGMTPGSKTQDHISCERENLTLKPDYAPLCRPH